MLHPSLRRLSKGLAFIMAVCMVYKTLEESMSRISVSMENSPLVPHAVTNHRLLARMLFVDSGLNGLICERLRSQKITNKTQLQELLSILGHSSTSGSQHGGQNVSLGCVDFKRKHGFDRWPVTAEEEQFPLAFSFKVHKNPAMFLRLLSVLWRPHNLYCVHVDGKTPQDVFQQFVSITECFDNVLLTTTRIHVVYSSISSLEADLECIKLALQSSIKWKYHLNLCGQEFPLKTNLEIVQILTALNGSNDIENYTPSTIFKEMSFKYRCKIHSGRLYNTETLKAPFEHNLTIFKGSAYNCINRAFLEWALHEQLHKEFLLWLNDTFAPDELFWASISNREDAPGGPGVVVSHKQDTMISKAVNWANDRGYRCRGKRVHAICILSSLDLPWLLSRHELIANKFDNKLDSTVLDCVEAELEKRALSGFTEWQQAVSKMQVPWSQAGHNWPRLSNLNWTLYLSLPQVSRVHKRNGQKH